MAAALALATRGMRRISAVMPTSNRRSFVPGAVAAFLAQADQDAELLILDDGSDPVADLVPSHPRIRYERHATRLPLGAKRNRLCELARGEFIVHWDDDDWHAPDRLSRQRAALEASGADICGLDRLIFVAADGSAAWDYGYGGPGPWVAGGSLCYRRDYWRRHPFPEIRAGEDTQWIMAAPRDRVHVMADNTFFVARIHPGNTSPKRTGSAWWRPRDPAPVLALMAGAPAPEPERPSMQITSHIRPAEPPAAAGVGLDLSVVIPFGGRDRLPHLAATLCTLRQAGPMEQIIVAEMGPEPLASDLCRHWAAEHVFIAGHGAFDKSRAINTGNLMARHSATLWCDGDLIAGLDFLARACHEFRSRGLDFLFPFSRVDYLDEADSRAVREGSRDPADCRPLRTLRPVAGGAIGGMGLVRTAFLRRHGGLVEGFRGWGGEDNAWTHKASLLGKVGITDRTDQIVHHLHHPDSGAIGRPWLANPHYAQNLELLRRVQAITTPRDFLAQFPPEGGTAPWTGDGRIAFLVVGGDPERLSLARDWADRLNRAFGDIAGVVEVEPGASAALPDATSLRLVVVLADPAETVRIEAACPDLPLIHVETDPAAERAPDLGRALVLPRTPDQAAAWGRRASPVCRTPWDVPGTEEALPVLLGPVSRLLGPPTDPRPAEVAPAPPSSDPPVVWTYWEGPRHDWIELCLETARLHVPGLRVLGPAEFDALRDRDRDIDLSRLHVAQRADFIRAFLLMRFGGLWIDADCVVMRSLDPLLEHLATVEVIAHRERQGLYSNAFLAMRPGSRLAARFYETICARLRSGRPIGWIALGNEPLTDLLSSDRSPRLELATELVQPICWSRPELYFQQAGDAEHEARRSREAWCYMLSNQNVLRQSRIQPSSVTAERSFFSHLVRASRREATAPLPRDAGAGPAPAGGEDRAALTRIFQSMSEAHRREGQESASGPGSSLDQTRELRLRLPLLLQSLGVRSILDAPCGEFHWMARENLGDCDYLGLDLLEDVVQANRRAFEAPGRRFETCDILADPLPRADLILCRDCLVHLSFADIRRVLHRFAASGSRYVLTTTFPTRTNTDVGTGGWRPLNLQAPPFRLSRPLRIINEKCSEGGGAFADKSLGLWPLAGLGGV